MVLATFDIEDYVALWEKSKKIEEYIRNKPQEDLEYDQMTLKEDVEPFMGESVKTSK